MNNAVLLIVFFLSLITSVKQFTFDTAFTAAIFFFVRCIYCLVAPQYMYLQSYFITMFSLITIFIIISYFTATESWNKNEAFYYFPFFIPFQTVSLFCTNAVLHNYLVIVFSLPQVLDMAMLNVLQSGITMELSLLSLIPVGFC